MDQETNKNYINQEVFDVMQVTSMPYGKYDYSKNPMNRKIPGSQGGEESFGNAVTKAEKEEKGKHLNLAVVAGEGGMGYGLIAMLPESSTPDNPIIQIISGVGGKREVYNIDISKIDPRNATEMEMFALCSYADEMGQGTGDSLGSYHTLSLSCALAKYNGYTGELNEEPPSWDQFANRRMDWTKTERFTVDVFKDSRDIKMVELVLWGNKLLNFFSDHIKKMSEDILHDDLAWTFLESLES